MARYEHILSAHRLSSDADGTPKTSHQSRLPFSTSHLNKPLWYIPLVLCRMRSAVRGVHQVGVTKDRSATARSWRRHAIRRRTPSSAAHEQVDHRKLSHSSPQNVGIEYLLGDRVGNRSDAREGLRSARLRLDHGRKTAQQVCDVICHDRFLGWWYSTTLARTHVLPRHRPLGVAW